MFQWQVVIQVLVHNINLIEQLNMRLEQSGAGDIVEIDSISGGTGGTPAVYIMLFKHLQLVQVQAQNLELQQTVHQHLQLK